MAKDDPHLFVKDSPVVNYVVPSEAFRDGLHTRSLSVLDAIIVHTTGDGPSRRMQEHPGKYEDTFDAALEIFRLYSDPGVGPHYVIGQHEGQIAQMCPENYKANHVSTKDSYRYVEKNWSKNEDMDWWKKTYPMYESPLQIKPNVWKVGSCNRVSIGVEVAPDPLIPRGHWSDKGMKNLLLLIEDIQKRRGPLGILTHSQVHPLHRSRNGRPYDPNPNQWNAFCEFAQSQNKLTGILPYSS